MVGESIDLTHTSPHLRPVSYLRPAYRCSMC